MKNRIIMLFATGLFAVSVAMAREPGEPIPVHGPAKVAVEDEERLGDTILELGTLAVTPGEIWKVVIGDGLTPGGIPIHPEGCVTDFNGVCVATTNLYMRSWSIKWGPWQAHGDANEWDLGYGTDETWLRFVRDSGQAYLAYTFTIIDAGHYRFELAWAGDSEAFPVLQVATDLTAGYSAADPADVTYTQPDASHLVIDYAVPDDYVFLSFRLFAASRLESGAYFSVPVHALGGITIDGTNVATVADVAVVADDLAAHAADTNAHAAAIENYMVAHGILADLYSGDPASNDGVECLAGWGNYFSFELNEWWRPIGTDFTFWSTNSTWVFRTPSRPRWRRDVGGQSEDFGLATTNDVAAVKADVDAHTDSILTIGDNLSDLEDRVDDIADGYLTEEDLAAYTTVTNALGQRVSEFETVKLGFVPVMSTTQTNLLMVPTNCPMRNLDISIDCSSFTSTNHPLVCRIPGNWSPAKPLKIRFLVANSAVNSRISYQIGTVQRAFLTPSSSPRLAEAHWSSECNAWQWHWIAMNANNTFYATNGAMKTSATGALPQSVEEWVAWRSSQAW